MFGTQEFILNSLYTVLVSLTATTITLSLGFSLGCTLTAASVVCMHLCGLHSEVNSDDDNNATG